MTIFVILFSLILFNGVSGAEVPLGVPFSALSAYRVGENFKCINSPLTISWSKVNDDYCDCPDGSDEPGFPACNNGVFFCRDVHYKILSLPSAFVNDEVVDCCDGSDEHDGRTPHESTCSVLAEAHQKARLVKQKGIQEGHEIFKEYVKTLKQRQIEQAIAEEKAAQLKKEAEAEAASHDVSSESQPSAEADSSKSSEEFASQPLDNAQTKDVDETAERSKDTEPHEDEENHEDQAEKESTDSAPVPPTTTEPPPPIDYGPEEGFRMLLEPPGYLEFTDKQYTYRFYPFDKIYQRNKNAEWSSSDISLGRWSGWSHAEADLLRENKYAVMVFENGQGCWNGPSRSVRVHVYCDSQNEIRSVEEPSRCVYTMQLHTPAACFEAPEIIMRRLHPELQQD